MAGKGGTVNVTLEQRIDNILGPWPTPDQTREAFLLLARHLQRHDELVTLQRDIDAEVGRAIRELRPKEGHLYAEARIRPGGETPCCCRVSWRTPGRDGVRNTRFYDSLADAIKEYNERED